MTKQSRIPSSITGLPRYARNDTTNEHGNIVIFILIAVFLFGALAYTFTRSARDGTNNISKQQAKIAAQEILNYARLVEGAVNRVRRNGCSESEISFENAVISGYSNTDAPDDSSCHIFELEGGKISYSSPPNNIDPLNLFSSPWTHYNFFGDADFIGIGTNGILESNSELYMLVALTSEEVCIQINNTLNLSLATNPPEDGGVALITNLFTGSFLVPATVMGDEVSSAPLENVTSACYADSDQAGVYGFYHILLAR